MEVKKTLFDGDEAIAIQTDHVHNADYLTFTLDEETFADPEGNDVVGALVEVTVWADGSLYAYYQVQ